MNQEWVGGLDYLKRAIQTLNLDLKGLTVLTEAASGNYVFTPFIASMAGAKKVIAVVRDSAYAPAEKVINDTNEIMEITGLKDIYLTKQLTSGMIAEVDIVTNSGFVRPINTEFISNMKDTAVIPLMYETWEYREGDLDLGACMKRGIPVLGTNESHPSLGVFEYCGALAVKLCIEAGLDLKESRIAIYSGDKFGPVIRKSLIDSGADVHLFTGIGDVDGEFLSSAEGLILADMSPKDIFAEDRIIDAIKDNLSLKVIQYTGLGDLTFLKESGIYYYPECVVEKKRMAFTLSYIGPLPVIYLIAGGMKVGQIMAKLRLEGHSMKETIERALKHPICQDFSDDQKRRLML